MSSSQFYKHTTNCNIIIIIIILLIKYKINGYNLLLKKLYIIFKTKIWFVSVNLNKRKGFIISTKTVLKTKLLLICLYSTSSFYLSAKAMLF